MTKTVQLTSIIAIMILSIALFSVGLNADAEEAEITLEEEIAAEAETMEEEMAEITLEEEIAAEAETMEEEMVFFIQ